MAPLARPYLHTLECHLDLDIIESKTRRRLAALYRLNGRRMEAGVEQVLARRFEALEDQALADFDRVYVCFDGDREELLDRSLNPAGSARAEVVVLPNAVSIPGPLPPRPKDGPFTFLFMGTLSYYPNEDALRYFCADVLPSLRQCAAREFRLNVLGPGATDAIKRLEELPEVQFVGEVPDVRPWYRDADAVVVPLRAGGGTRIKILEAFSYRTPVVSTSIGLEGIDARDDEHALVADTPESFTAQCLRLMTEEDLAERLTERAYALFLRAYSPGAVVRAILPCHPPHPQPLSRISGEGSDEPQD
jgi:glycosyltransferase involved in cell wall biosynthesis